LPPTLGKKAREVDSGAHCRKTFNTTQKVQLIVSMNAKNLLKQQFVFYNVGIIFDFFHTAGMAK